MIFNMKLPRLTADWMILLLAPVLVVLFLLTVAAILLKSLWTSRR